MKGRCILIPENFRRKHWKNYTATTWVLKKTKVLACESIYWIKMNADIEKTVNKLFYAS